MNIAFYFPYPTVGGVSLLFLRCAEYLSENHDIYIIDLEDGYMAKNLPSNSNFISYTDLGSLPDDVLIITQSCPLWRIPYLEKLSKSSKILFWNLHPDNFKYKIGSFDNLLLNHFVNFIFLPRKNKLKKLVKILHLTGSLLFMDKNNKDNTENLLDVNIQSPIYMPITNSIYIKSRHKYHPPKNGEEIRCIVVGRLSGFKVTIVKHLISRLNSLIDQNIHLTVVGDGDAAEEIKKLLASNSNINSTYINDIHFDKLDTLLKDKHLAFAMGTSALDSAALGIPTICLDYSNSEICKNYKFKYIYDLSGYNLGREITLLDYEDFDSLGDMIDDIYANGLHHSNRTYSYYLENHSCKVIDKLNSHICNNGILISELLSLNLHQEDFITKMVIKIFNKMKIDDSGFVKI